ncbi:MAG: 1-deoxy-D-xylulose-5-phosphate reductoisomerase, partial [SAR324 cluster bacterium]|nr:1-deoxy-D-xylulose-5-phosphate reductoisomerase [SAR324 cluster bacterium]
MKSTASFSKSSETQASVLTKVSVLGATGSIGLKTLEIVRQFPQKFQIEALSCKNSIEQLREQI